MPLLMQNVQKNVPARSNPAGESSNGPVYTLHVKSVLLIIDIFNVLESFDMS